MHMFINLLIRIFAVRALNPKLGTEPRKLVALLRGFFADNGSRCLDPGLNSRARELLILRKSELIRVSGLIAEIYAAASKRYFLKNSYVNPNSLMYRGNPKVRELRSTVEKLSNLVAKEYLRLEDTELHLNLGGCPVLLQNTCVDYCTSILYEDRKPALELITKIEKVMLRCEDKKAKEKPS